MEHNKKNDNYNQYVRKGGKLKTNKYKKILIVLVIIIIVLIAILLIKYFKKTSNNDNLIDSEINNQEQNNQIEENPDIEQNLPEEGNKLDENENQENDVTDENKINIPSESAKYDYSKPVPKSEKVGLEYFNDAVFIGDSRTEGFIINNGLAYDIEYYTSKGLQVNTIFLDKVINMNGTKVTIMEALARTSFSKVYIMLGINETGWPYSNLFIEKYCEIIDGIRNINPNCTIYVQSILPVSQSVSNTHSYIKNSKINEFNSLILQMAKDKSIYYINVREALEDSNGALPEEAAVDGIHLDRAYCEKWLEYLTEHIVKEI